MKESTMLKASRWWDSLTEDKKRQLARNGVVDNMQKLTIYEIYRTAFNDGLEKAAATAEADVEIISHEIQAAIDSRGHFVEGEDYEVGVIRMSILENKM